MAAPSIRRIFSSGTPSTFLPASTKFSSYGVQKASCRLTLAPPTRHFSQSQKRNGPLELAFQEWDPPGGAPKRGELVILHGLFGSGSNWRTLSKAMAQSQRRKVYTLDLRNHGSSPHSEEFDYPSMASDVIKFIQDRNLQDVCLLGHSMGGKAAMSLALSKDRPSSLTSLVIADISPIRGRLSKEFEMYVEKMLEVEKRGVKNRKEADEVLKEVEQSLSIRQFLLTNLVIPPPSSEKPIHFRNPLSTIYSRMEDLGSFDYDPCEENATLPTFEKPTLLIRGTKSNYVKPKGKEAARKFFPNVKVQELEAGHWVHAEKPAEFMKLIESFP